MPIRLFAPRYWPTWLGLGLLRTFAVLPFGWLIPMGTGLGALMLRLQLPLPARPAQYRIVPAAVERRGARRTARAALRKPRHQPLRDGLHLVGIPERFRRIVKVEGRENLEAALARGQGVILLTAHFTTLEIGARILASVEPTSFLYRPTRNEALAWSLARCRCRFGGHPIPRDDIRALIKALKHNECVWYAPDQSYRKKGAQMVELFGIPAATNTFTSRLARMTGATCCPISSSACPVRRVTGPSYIRRSTTFRASVLSPTPNATTI